MRDFDRALAEDPHLAPAYADRGVAYAQLGRLQEALLDLDRAVALDPNLARAYDRRGVVKLRLGRARAAVADFDQAIRRDPRFAQAHMNRRNPGTPWGIRAGPSRTTTGRSLWNPGTAPPT
jgi:tetratricopeptide (TPR) repeat protein